MVFVQLLLADKMDRGIIVRKVIGHGHDLFPNRVQIRPVLCHHKTLPGMLFSDRQVRIASAPHSLQRFFHRNGILSGILYPFDPADGIRMALAHPLPPERIIASPRQNGVGVQPVQGEHPRIPPCADQPHMAAFLCRLVHSLKMFRYLCMGVKAVHHIKQFRHLRRLYWKIRSAASAQNHHVNGIFHGRCFLGPVHRRSFCQYTQTPRISSGKHRRQLHIRVMLHCALHPSSQISIA